MIFKRTIRPAVLTDQRRLAEMIRDAYHVHRHLDWRDPLSWIGSPPFIVLEDEEQVCAALACPPDPLGVAWLRLFVSNGINSDGESWQTLYEAAHRELACQQGITVAAIVLEKWILPILESSGFVSRQQIVMLQCNEYGKLENGRGESFTIRPMLTYDLPAVADVDASAFDLLWQNSLSSLSSGYKQAVLAAVAETDGQVIGYHISTRNALGIHLARLAVRPGVQGRGVGRALVADMIRQAERRGVHHFTVNTQSDNAVSLALYEKIGFHETGERYPVYQLQVS
jgi:[ribosomal protein S18]-alanine N-acetyltransferase